MPTLRDYIATLPKEEQDAFLDDIKRRIAFQKVITEEGRATAEIGGALSGLAHGGANALFALAQLGVKALPGDAGEWADKPLMGPGGHFRSDPSLGHGVGPGYALGGFGGFLGSLALPAGEVGLAAKLFKGGSYASKAAKGATTLGLMSGMRSPGTAEERLSYGVHALPTGAVFGVLGRMQGLRLKDGSIIAGRAAERFLRKHGSIEEAMKRGLLDKTSPIEPLSRHVARSAGRGTLAGFATPGFSPIEMTGNPYIDSAIFNTGFFGAMAALHGRRPAPGRERAFSIAREKGAKVEDSQRPRQLSLFPETEGATDVLPRVPVQQRLPFEGEHPLDTAAATIPRRNRKGKFQATEPTQVELFTPDELADLRPEPPPTISPEAVPSLYEQTPFGPALRFQIGQRVRTASGKEGEVESLNTDGSITVDGEVLSPDTLKPIATEATPTRPSELFGFARDWFRDFLPTPGETPDLGKLPLAVADDLATIFGKDTRPSVRSLMNEIFTSPREQEGVSPRAQELLSKFSEAARVSLNLVSRRAYRDRVLHVEIDANTRFLAFFDAVQNKLSLTPDFFRLPAESRANILAHELAHWKIPRLSALSPEILTGLLSRAGFVGRVLRTTEVPFDIEGPETPGLYERAIRAQSGRNVRERKRLVIDLAEESVRVHFPGATVERIFERTRSPEGIRENQFVWSRDGKGHPNYPDTGELSTYDPVPGGLDFSTLNRYVALVRFPDVDAPVEVPLLLRAPVNLTTMQLRGKAKSQTVLAPHFLLVSSNWLETADAGRLPRADVPKPITAQMDGRRYGWSSPTEFLAELSLERARLPQADFDARFPGARELLDYSHGSDWAAITQGSYTLAEYKKRAARQPSLFPEEEAWGPVEWSGRVSARRSTTRPADTTGEHINALPGNDPAKWTPWERYTIGTEKYPGPGRMSESHLKRWILKTSGVREIEIRRKVGEDPTAVQNVIESIYTEFIGKAAIENFSEPRPSFETMHTRFAPLLKDIARRHVGKELKTVGIESLTSDNRAVNLADMKNRATEGTEVNADAPPSEIELVEQQTTSVPPPPQAATEGKARIPKGEPSPDKPKLLFVSTDAKLKTLASRLDYAFSRGLTSLESVVPRGVTREVLLRRFGGARDPETSRPLYTNPHGEPLWPKVERWVDIAKSTGLSVRHVKRLVTEFALGPLKGHVTPGTVHISVPGEPPMEPTGFIRPGEAARGYVEPAEPKKITRRHYRPVLEPGTTKRGRVPKEVVTEEEGRVTKREHFVPRSLTEPFQADVEYVDPVTGKTLTRQTSLFDAKSFVQERVAHESKNIEPPDSGTEPPPPTRQERAAQRIAAAAIAGQKAAVQREFRGERFPSKRRKTPIFKVSKTDSIAAQANLYATARAKIGGKSITWPEFKALRPEQQLEHVMTRLVGAAGKSQRYRNTLNKYAGLAHAHKKQFFHKRYPTFYKLANSTRGKSADRSKIAMREVLDEAAEKLFVDIVPGRTLKGRVSFRLKEQDTGIETEVVDMGTAALLLDLRARRLAGARSYTPPEMEFIRMTGGGPRGPRGPQDPAADSEHAGIPPGGMRNAVDTEWGIGLRFSAKFTHLRDHAARVTRKTGDVQFYEAADQLINRSTEATARSQRAGKKWRAIQKRHGVSKSPYTQRRLDQFALDIDMMSWELTKAGVSYAETHRRITKHLDSLAERFGLAPNEIAAYKEAQPLFKRLGRIFGVLTPDLIPYYYPRVRKFKVTPRSSVVKQADVNIERAWHALFERTGDLTDAQGHFTETFDAYTRRGFRYKLLHQQAGAYQTSPLELAKEVVRRYSDKHGVPQEFAEPLANAINRSQGAPDPRYAESQMHARRSIQWRKDYVDAMNNYFKESNAPLTNQVSRALQWWSDSLGLKLNRADVATLGDIFIGLHRGRTFGIHAMRAIRHVSLTSFTVYPRVGARHFGGAVKDLLDPAKMEHIASRAVSAGALKPAWVHSYVTNRNRLLSGVEKLSFLYSKLDAWERLVAFRAQERLTTHAIDRYKQHKNEQRFVEESGLSYMHPAFRIPTLNALRRGNFPEAIREHARLLVDHSVYDYTTVNQPRWSGSVWGRVFGQYGRWSLATVENMLALGRWGTPRQRAMAGVRYGLAASAVYGLGVTFGVKTVDWIPFIHSLAYSGGPGFSVIQDGLDILSGNPLAQDQLKSNWERDPVATILGPGFKFAFPAGDVVKALAAETNLDRRQRRLAGVPRFPARSPHEMYSRLLGFRPIYEEHKHMNLLKELLGAPFVPAGEAIRGTIERNLLRGTPSPPSPSSRPPASAATAFGLAAERRANQ
jgi:hypothetical protein